MIANPDYASSLLDPEIHDLTLFDSGEPELDTWPREHATAAARARVAHTFVWVDIVSTAVVAYYSLCAHAVPREGAPNRIGRGVPDPVPAALIAKLALDRSLQGMRLGGVLLADALERIIATGEAGLAVRAIVVDASTDRGRSLYARFGFVPSPRRADRMIVRAGTIAKGLRRD